jgi:pyruvate/2-oxoglutarate dehydrogenase complex dihydrolipoamide dehydrogenase (E3) component
MSKNIHYDLCIIGGGAAGLSVAAGAAQLGVNVALIEKSEMGGECLNSGCVPSKALIAAARKADVYKKSFDFGIKYEPPEVRFKGVMEHINEIISYIAPHDSQERFEGLGVDVYRDKASFISENKIQCGDQTISANNFVIATGSSPLIPQIKGLEPDKIHTNETIFKIREKPETLCIIGGGPIGVEMAQSFSRLGTRVYILEQNSILPLDEPELSAIIKNSLEKDGVIIKENAAVIEIEHRSKKHTITYSHHAEELKIDVNCILVAAGRQPNIEELNLTKTEVVYDKSGIITDRYMRTSNKKIYAAGDCVSGPKFTHVASYQAGIIIRNMIFKMRSKVSYDQIPWVSYTDPELAHTGLTEQQAREKYGNNIKILKWKLKENDRAMAERRLGGMIKIIVNKKGKILGAGIAAPHAGEMISLWSLALSQKLKTSDIANLIMPYPTYSEIGKRAAASYYTQTLFSDRTRWLVRALKKIPFI